MTKDIIRDVNDVVQYMGWFPCYKYPEKETEDDEFVYYKFLVPHEEDKEGLILAVSYFPVYVGVELLGEDETFKYFRCRVPKVFLETVSPILGVPYGVMFEEDKMESYKEKMQAKAREMRGGPGLTLAAGTALPRAVKSKASEGDGLDGLDPEQKQYEVVFKCKSEQCGLTHTEITTDIWSTIFGAVCGQCLGGLMLESCKEVEDGEFD